MALAVAITMVLVACGDDEPDTVAAAPETTTTADSGTVGDATAGTVAVHIQPVDGVFVEGFEVGLRFETVDGDVVGSTLWSDFVESQGSPTIDDYYDSVLEQDVPAGVVVVLATVNVGIGPPPETPDVDGELSCRLEVEVPADGQVDVEVTFDDPADCLRLA